MESQALVRYYGWSALSVVPPTHALFFDPFYRRYCGADWFGAIDFDGADYIAVTHGHEEHFLDVPVLAKLTRATVIGSGAATSFLRWRRRMPKKQLVTLNRGCTISVPGFKAEAFAWKHRDINLVRAIARAVFRGNTTQLAWAWSSATRAPFYAPYGLRADAAVRPDDHELQRRLQHQNDRPRDRGARTAVPRGRAARRHATRLRR